MNSFLKSTVSVFVFKMFGMAVSFFFQIIITRSFGENGYGEYTYFLSIINVISTISLLGLDTYLVKEIPRLNQKSEEYSLLKIALEVVFLILVIILIFINVLFFFNKSTNNASYFNLYLVIGIIIFSFIKLLDGFFCGQKKTEVAVFLNSFIRSILRLLIFIWLFSFNKNLNSLFLAFLIEEVICLLIRIIYIALKKKQIERKLLTSKYCATNLIKGSLVFYFINIASIIYLNVDKIVIGTLLTSSDLGLYKASENYAVLISIFVVPFMTFWPHISSLYNENKIDILQNQYQKITLLLLTCAIPVVIIFSMYSKFLLGIFGKGFVEGEFILIILLLGYFSDVISGPIGAMLRLTNYSRLSLFINVIFSILSIVLSIVVSSFWGVIGIAITRSSLLFLNNLTNVVMVKKKLNVFPYNKAHLKILMYGIIVFVFINIVKVYISEVYISFIISIIICCSFIFILLKLYRSAKIDFISK